MARLAWFPGDTKRGEDLVYTCAVSMLVDPGAGPGSSIRMNWADVTYMQLFWGASFRTLTFVFSSAQPTKLEKSFYSVNIASGPAMWSQKCMLGDLTLANGKRSSNFLYTCASTRTLQKYGFSIVTYGGTRNNYNETETKIPAITFLDFANSICPCKKFGLNRALGIILLWHLVWYSWWSLGQIVRVSNWMS